MTDSSRFTLITGASEGLGKALSLECATRKQNLVLVALPGKELAHLGDFIRRNFGVDVFYFEADLSDEEQCRNLVQHIFHHGLNINILINNAGLGGTRPFEETPLPFFEKQILLNVLGTTVITRLLLDELEKNAPSWILNVGSMASFYFLPHKEVYAATKSYIYSLSGSLRLELAPKNISVSVLCPGGINTNLPITLMNKANSWLARQTIMNPEAVAFEAIEGMFAKKPVIIPGYLNRIIHHLSRMLPGFLCRMLSCAQMKRLRPDHPLLKLLPPRKYYPVNTA